MTNEAGNGTSGELLLEMRGLRIEGQSDEQWHEIVHGIDVELRRGEVLGLIGESGAGKSTIGIASMGYSRPGCRICGGTIVFDGIDISPRPPRRPSAQIRGKRIAYVAQSAAASFNPAHRLIEQYVEAPVRHGVLKPAQAVKDAKELYRRLDLPDPDRIGYRYPHQVSGGQLQRAMVAMAMACPARPDRLRRAHHGARRHHPDRGAGGDQGSSTSSIRPPSTSPTTSRWWPSSPTASWCCATATWSKRAAPARCWPILRRNTPGSFSRCARSASSRRTFTMPTGPCSGSKNLNAYYGDFHVLKDISVDVHRGKTMAVVGESGSGKSTLARAITGLLPPATGKVMFDGQEMPPSYTQRKPDDLRRMQMIYQMPDTALNPRQKISEIIGRPVRFYLGKSGRERRKIGSRNCCASSSCRRTSSTVTRASCPAAKSSVSVSPGRWPRIPT